eukprot:CAMPEP_0113618088 /NCGR_PEP_ID=MMETSP0017_2-20120614/9146_1 /TAXON_ID=2856 /ORGANISM="Cylindrotheca closterium" /LENGTH=227 /DNA_ID=CAMNT_0000527565 /DNA_START=1066 /DNA_END=1749 /DNA_ORIENTATION=- /assembly_acc=CAM_ASM_000147
MSCSDDDYLEVSLRFVAQQRALEIARNGFSDITLPEQEQEEATNNNTKKSSSRTLFDREGEGDKHHVDATLLIARTLKEIQTTRHGIEVKIHHDSRMAEQRLMRGNDRGACLSMTRVMQAQFEYIHVLQRIAAIKAVQYNLENGLAEADRVEENLNEILSIPEGDKPTKFDRDEVLDQLEYADFFPILDTKTGAISFTSSYDYASDLEVLVHSRGPHKSPRSVQDFL